MPTLDLLSPDTCVVAFIDFQPQMAFATRSIDGESLLNNVTGLARAARVFDVPTVLTTVAARTFSGPTFAALHAALGDPTPIDRTTMNAWEDPSFVAAIRATGRRRLVLAGLWTEVCVVMPALSALREGFDVYVVVDACGGVSPTAHEAALQRMAQAGVTPLTWLQFLLELQRDWARRETYAAVGDVVRRHAGIYGIGVAYADAMGLGSEAAGPPAERLDSLGEASVAADPAVESALEDEFVPG